METRLSSQEIALQNNVKELQAKDKQITELQNNVNGLQAKDKQILELLNEVKEIGGGSVDCGSSGWIKSGYWQSKVITVNLHNNYKTTPLVHLSLMFVDDDTAFPGGNQQDNEFGVEIVSVSPTSFTMRCKMYSDQTMQSMKAGWVSFPQF